MTVRTRTALNGRLPASMLAIAEEAGPRGAQLLRADAAATWHAMLAAGMPAGCLRSGYRTRAEQAAEVERAKAGLTPSAAPVGRSWHGEGLAVDVDEPARSWLRSWGAGYGVVGDLVPGEPWHFEIFPTTATAAREDTDMLTPEAQAQVQQAAHDALIGVLRSEELAARIRAAVRAEIAVIPTAVLDARVSDDTGTLAQTVRDTRRIARRHEQADYPNS